MFRSLRNYSILFLFCWAIMASYCIFSIFAWTFSLFLCLSLKTSEALFLVSSIFFQVFTSSCFRRAIRFAKSWASLSTLFKGKTFYAFHNHSHWFLWGQYQIIQDVNLLLTLFLSNEGSFACSGSLASTHGIALHAVALVERVCRAEVLSGIFWVLLVDVLVRLNVREVVFTAHFSVWIS